MANEPSKVRDPTVKRSANFCGAINRMGKKFKDSAMSSDPAKNTPANCANFFGDMARVAAPDTLSLATERAPLAEDVATVKLSPNACMPFPEYSLAISCAACPLSCSATALDDALAAAISRLCEKPRRNPCACSTQSAVLARSTPWVTVSWIEAVAEDAPSETRSRLRVTPSCTPFTCSPQSTAFTFSTPIEMPLWACPAASAACCRTRPAACLAHMVQRGSSSPGSKFGSAPAANGTVSSSDRGTACNAAARALCAIEPNTDRQSAPGSPAAPSGAASTSPCASIGQGTF
mmetsp:Transcript_54542/g.152118  ORF Transcript_54542/g.152118 Transcript_54542/m.152118 type:complete len:291 (+) Transcript_54542:324-1196(+)